VLKLEGGYQDMPEDAGNWLNGANLGTKWGITPKTYLVLTGKTPSKHTMQNLTESEAKELLKYYAFYVRQVSNDFLAVNIFDMCVNAGPRRACVLAQRLVGATEDGIIGPVTASLLEANNVTTDDYVKARISYYERVAQHNPVNAKFLRGWINRANKFTTESLTNLLK
jgi:lysozyme family protein